MSGSVYDIYRLSYEFATVDLGLASSMLAVAIGSNPLRVGCTPQQKAHWLSRIASEGLIVAYAVNEPEAGSDVQFVETEAVPLVDRDGAVTHYRLTGIKQFITNGSIADIYTVLAKAPGGPSFFIVERKAPGVLPGAPEATLGIRLSDTALVRFRDVVVPADHLVGGVEGRGLAQIDELSVVARMMVAGFGLGAGSAALRQAIAYAQRRRKAGTLLTEKQGFTHKLLVPNSVRLAAARAYVEEVARQLDTGATGGHVESAIAKLFATEAGDAAADDAVQALGGYGYLAAFEVEKIRRDARILRIYQGTSEIMQIVAGGRRIGQIVESQGHFYDALASSVATLDDCGGPAAAHAARFVASAIAIASREQLFEQQHALFECAAPVAEVETAAALAAAAGASDDALLKAQARVWASDVLFGSTGRLLKLFSASSGISPWVLEELHASADATGALEAQRGRLADMDYIARRITAQPPV
jgi:alkylation response protein AidB-like acyl-CoA dehydrogenase